MCIYCQPEQDNILTPPPTYGMYKVGAKSAALYGTAQHPGTTSPDLTTARPVELLLLQPAGGVHSP